METLTMVQSADRSGSVPGGASGAVAPRLDPRPELFDLPGGLA